MIRDHHGVVMCGDDQYETLEEGTFRRYARAHTVTVNCSGSRMIRYQGGSSVHADELDPPSPSPHRCFEMGEAVARTLNDTPWRVVDQPVAYLSSRSWSRTDSYMHGAILGRDLDLQHAKMSRTDKMGEAAQGINCCDGSAAGVMMLDRAHAHSKVANAESE